MNSTVFIFTVSTVDARTQESMHADNTSCLEASGRGHLLEMFSFQSPCPFCVKMEFESKATGLVYSETFVKPALDSRHNHVAYASSKVGDR